MLRCVPRQFLILLFAVIFCASAFSSPKVSTTKIGNGDDGSDLEGAVPIVEGPIFEAKQRAVNLIERLNVQGIPHLGKLIPEVDRSPLFLAKQDVSAKPSTDDGPFHSDMRGFVYARTFAEPHASTRFFPIALKLETDQLIALHIHEGLHRSLPKHVREDEDIVSKITLAITTPGSNFDQLKTVMASTMPEPEREEIPVSEDFKNHSSVGYDFRNFRTHQSTSTYRIESMHIVHSELYPFQWKQTALGFGIGASLIRRVTVSHMGPLSLSVTLKLGPPDGFQFGGFANIALNTLSADEFKNSPFGRDMATLGISVRKNMNFAYIENFLSVTAGDNAKHKIGLIEYTYDYGQIYNIKIRTGVRLFRFDLGLFAELYLANSLKVASKGFNFDSGRYRLLSIGPEAAWVSDILSVGLSGRFLVDSTKGANFDYVGDLMGPGIAQGSAEAFIKFFF